MDQIDKVVRILVAEDHTIVRQGLVKLLEAEPMFRVVGEARNGREAISQVEECHPDVVIMDIAMPILNGIEATRRIKRWRPGIKVLILSMYSQDRYISEVLSHGASGYLLKDSSGSDIIQAIQTAMQGGVHLSPSISRRVVEDYVNLKCGSSENDLYSRLSDREREVFQLIAEGYSTKEIAELLCVSSSTIKTHRCKIQEKLQVTSTSKLLQFALRLGIVDL